MPDLLLSINGNQYHAWKSLTLARSIERGPHEYSIAAQGGRKWFNDARRAIREGDKAQLMFGNEVLSTGAIDDRYPEYDAENHQMNLNGRSRTADLVDCSLNTKTFNNLSLAEIAKDLCDPFKIPVINDAKADKKFETLVLNEGQSIWDFLETAARIRAVLLVEDASGNLHITRSGIVQSETPLILGKNILNARANFSWRNVYSDYEVLANQAAVQTLTSEDTVINNGSAKDARLKNRYRPLTIVNDDPADTEDCDVRARWHLNVHNGRSQSVVYSVKGFTQNNGKTWVPNMLVSVSDPYADINEQMLTIETRLIRDDKGDRTEIMVRPPSAFDLRKLAEPASNASGGFNVAA